MNASKIAAALSDHQGSWDSWGWHCSCGARERLSDLPVAENVRTGKGPECREGLISHQARAIADAVA